LQSEVSSNLDEYLLVEIAATEATVDESDDIHKGIEILSDARHCWRKDARFSDVACIENKTDKVLKVETVYKRDDRSSQNMNLLA